MLRAHPHIQVPWLHACRTPFDVETKADASPVTIADRESETAMRHILQQVGTVSLASLPPHFLPPSLPGDSMTDMSIL